MADLHFNLNSGGENFSSMDSAIDIVQGVVQGAAIAALPQDMNNNNNAHTYMIINRNSNNYYIGITTDLEGRFDPRMRVVNELGLGVQYLYELCAIWGSVEYTPSAGGGTINVNPVNAGGGATSLTQNIDGMQVMNLESVLILYVINHLGLGGTITNAEPGTITNNTNNPINITFSWPNYGGQQNDQVQAGTSAPFVWAVGAAI